MNDPQKELNEIRAQIAELKKEREAEKKAFDELKAAHEAAQKPPEKSAEQLEAEQLAAWYPGHPVFDPAGNPFAGGGLIVNDDSPIVFGGFFDDEQG